MISRGGGSPISSGLVCLNETDHLKYNTKQRVRIMLIARHFAFATSCICNLQHNGFLMTGLIFEPITSTGMYNNVNSRAMAGNVLQTTRTEISLGFAADR